jgi:dTMP kinase
VTEQHLPRGFFLSLDGLDGAGKSTQLRQLADWLRGEGRSVTECTDPGGTELGQAIRDLLLDFRQSMGVMSEALLFMASRAQLVAEVIRPALAASHVVLSDRFLLANVVYQGYGGGLDPEWLYALGLFGVAGVEPDLTFVLDLPIEEARTRSKSVQDRIERRPADYHQRIRDGFLEQARRRSNRIVVLDARQPAEAVQAALRAETRRRLETHDLQTP